MTAALVAALATVAASALIGAGLGRAAGLREWRAWMPAVGLAGLFVLLLAAVRLPGHGATALVVLVVAALAGGWAGREALRRLPWREAAPTAGALLLLAAVPFVVNGRFGPLGQSVNNDLAFHMTWADWLGGGRSFDSSGYPLGPHSLVASLARLPAVDVEQAFAGVLMAVPVLTGLCALGFLGDLSARLRVLAALLAGLPYLAASYYAQASFKEPQMALFFLAAVGALQHGGRRAPGLALVVLGAGSVACFSAAGLAWVAVAAAAALGLRRRRRIGRRAWIAVGGLVAVGVLATVPTGFFDTGPGRYLFDSPSPTGGNFRGELNPLEVLGVWPSPDFQAARSGAGWVAALAVGLVAAATGLWLWRRRDDPLPALALLLALVLAAAIAAVTIPYISAKALVVAAPLLTVVVLGGLLGARPRRPLSAVGWALGCAIFVALAAHSSLLALRGAVVTPPAAGAELSALATEVRGEPTLFLGKEPYAPWYLRATRLTTVPRAVPPGAAPASARRAEARRHLRLDPDELAVLFVGGDSEHNREAARFLAREVAPRMREGTRLLLAGRCCRPSPRRAEGVTELGWVDDLPGLLAAADVGVNPVARAAGASVKVTDFLGAGLPVVATPEGARGAEGGVTVVSRERFAEEVACWRPLPAAGSPPSWPEIGRRLLAEYDLLLR